MSESTASGPAPTHPSLNPEGPIDQKYTYIIRPALPSDIPAIATLCCTIFTTDFMIHLFPRHQSHPDGWRRFWLRKLKRSFYDRGSYLWVAVSNQSQPRNLSCERSSGQSEGPKVIGVSVWSRLGSSDTAQAHQQRNNNAYAAFERAAVDLQDWYTLLFNLDCPAGDPVALRRWDGESRKGLTRYFKTEERWWLGLMAVDEGWQGRGVGKRLVGWGMERAKEEGVVCTNIASRIGRKMYGRLGWRVVDWMDYSYENVEGNGAVMVWDGLAEWTRGSETGDERWVERRGEYMEREIVWR